MTVINKNTNVKNAGDTLPAQDLMDTLFTGGEVSTFPMGEAFTGATTPQPAKIVNDLNQPIFDAINTFGSAALPYRSLKFKPQNAVTIASVRTALFRATDPSTNLTIEIQTDSAGVPSGTPVTNGTSATIATSTLQNSNVRYYNFTFSTPPALSANTVYHCVIKVSATNANVISMCTLANASKFCNFDGGSYNGTTWSAGQVLPYFEIVPSTVGSYSLWRSQGNGVEPLNSVDGFVITTGSANATGAIVRGGTVQGFSGLAPNANYHLANSIGTITLNENEGMFVARALNATDIEIAPRKQGARNARSYVSMTQQGSAFESAAYYAYEDGYFIVSASMGAYNATAIGLYAYVGNANTNGGSPISLGQQSMVITVSISNANSSNYGTVTIPVRKGDRLMVGSGAISGAGTATTIVSLYFQSAV